MANLTACPACSNAPYGYQGQEACSACDGEGCHYADDGGRFACFRCHGDGTVDCAACQGEGLVPCEGQPDLAALMAERDPALTLAELGFQEVA